MGIELVSRPAMRFEGALSGQGAKNVVAGLVAAVAAGAFPIQSTAAGIELGEGLSVTGFVDMSMVVLDVDGSPSSETAAIDQVETDFLYAGSGGVSAEVDIEYGESGSGNGEDETFVEQAFITKKFNDSFSLKAGRFLSYSGWEAEEPTGLFQYSGTGYAPFFYGYYQQGVSAYYDAAKVDFMASVVNSAFDPLDRGSDELGYELGVAVQPAEGLTAKVFYISNKNDALGDSDKIVNAWVSYAVSKFTFAAEYNTADYASGGDGDGFLVMGNYASGPFGLTLRYHDFEIKDASGSTAFENSAFTISPSYKVGSNLLVVGEFRTDDFGGGVDSNMFALEALFTF